MPHQRSVVFHACATVLAACIVPALPVKAQTTPDTTVVNYNQRLGRSTGELTVAIIRAPQRGKEPPSMGDIKTQVGISSRIIRTDSRGKTRLRIVSTQEGGSYHGHVWDIVTVHPYGSGISHSGNGHTDINGYGALMHEFGHILGCGESDSDIDGVHEGDGDPSSWDGKDGPAICFNAPQLHWLGWTDSTDCVRINDLISDGQSIEVPIRPIDNNSVSDSTIPMAYEYDIPGTYQQLWIAMPRSLQSSTHSIEGGSIFVYSVDNGANEHANWWMGTNLVGRFGCLVSQDNVVQYLTINPISYVGKPATYKSESGKTVKTIDVSQATLRISLAAP